jgi:TRAP-type mannitol/chloroaromatic compound transport system permease large subunit
VVTLMGLLALAGNAEGAIQCLLSPTGVICAGGTLGILIPPSIMLIVYAASVGRHLIVRVYCGGTRCRACFSAGLYLDLYCRALDDAARSVAPKPSDDEVPAPTPQARLRGCS